MDILFVMNAQNSYLSEKGSMYMDEKSEILKVRMADYLGSFSKKKVFFRETHSTEDTFFINGKTHSIATTKDAVIHDSFKKHADYYFDNIRYNAFFDTKLESFLKRQKVKGVGIMGLETNTSVLFTAEELRNRGYEVTIIEPCTMSKTDYFHTYSIALMKNFLGVRITNG